MQVSLVKSSFYFTYIFLITTGTICFIEALRNPVPQIRHIMNLETCISVVAGYFYGLFVEKINKAEKESQEKNNDSEENKELPLEKINDMRYTDWVISTPLMLLVLCMVLGYENKITVTFLPFIGILLFNFLMLGAGYLGELGKLTLTLANSIGFVFFFIMYGIIWKIYMTGSKITSQSKVIFWLFVGLWAMYGVFYQSPQMTKIFGYNILDLLAKAFVGIFFWFYLTKSIKF
jgi:bacteriorhodopsin